MTARGTGAARLLARITRLSRELEKARAVLAAAESRQDAAEKSPEGGSPACPGPEAR